MASVVSTLRWMGSKVKHLNFILPLLPKTSIYVEPFAGSAAVLVNKPRSELTVYNDLDKRLVAFFTALRDNPDELVKAISLTPYSRSEFAYAIKHEAVVGGCEAARLAWVLSRQSFAGRASTFGRRIGGNSSYLRYPDLDKLARRVAGVTILNRDALDVIAKYDSPDTLFYLDPPYAMESRATKESKYRHEYDTQEHRTLGAMLKTVRGKVAISGYGSDLYDDIYRQDDGWHTFRGPMRTSNVDNAPTTKVRSRSSAREVLWTNYSYHEAGIH